MERPGPIMCYLVCSRETTHLQDNICHNIVAVVAHVDKRGKRLTEKDFAGDQRRNTRAVESQ